MTHTFLYLRVILGLLFIVAGLLKAWDRRAFHDAVTGYRIVSPRLTPVVATAIMGVELVGGVLLLAGTYEWLGAALLGLLLVAFDFALIVNLRRGRRNLDCGCFGGRTIRIGWGHVAQNTVLLAMTFLIAWAALFSNVTTGAWDPATHAVTILAAVYSVVLFLAAQEMVSVRAGLVRVLSSRVEAE